MNATAAKDNANPIIHRPAGASAAAASSSSASSSQDWWRDEAIHVADERGPFYRRQAVAKPAANGMDVDGAGEDGEEREEIDADEVFGELERPGGKGCPSP